MKNCKCIIQEVEIKYNKKKKLKNISVKQSKNVFNLFKDLSNEQQEQFYVVHLNSGNELISWKKEFSGGLKSSQIHPEIVFRNALLCNAAGLIIVHNHPSGKTEPSFNDEDITKKLSQCANMLHIKLLDHIIIGDSGYYSMSDSGNPSLWITGGD